MDPRKVTVSRYVTPLREGGSLPAVVEGDDEGLYVIKFRGAGQGPKALVAEFLCGQLARALGLPMPEFVVLKLDVELGRTEPDYEIRTLIQASGGVNFGIDYLPGSITFDPLVTRPDPEVASAIVWFDAFICNVDRTPRNVNLLLWHKRLWLIDHGAALYFHHAWAPKDDPASNPFPMIKDHVLLPYASHLEEVDRKLTELLQSIDFVALVNSIPEEWLVPDGEFTSVAQLREAYLRFLKSRCDSPHLFLKEAVRARSANV
jgi:hypothetical protein